MRSTTVTAAQSGPSSSSVMPRWAASRPRSRSGVSAQKTGAGVGRTSGLIIRLLYCMAVAVTLAAPLSAQTADTDGAQKTTRQSPEAAAEAIKSAEKTGARVDATIELQTPLAAIALEYVKLPGQIQSISISSNTSDWTGAINSTPEAPIISLADGLRRYEQLYRNAGPGDPYAFFVVTAFTVRGSASEVSRARDSFPEAAFVSVAETAKLSKSQTIDSASSKEAPVKEVYAQEGAVSAAAASDTAFVPSKAELNIQTLANSDRRIDVTFSWNSAADLAGLSRDRATLEIQVLFWNHAADAKRSNVTYVGPVKAWGTNNTLFRGYFDTPALNGTGIGGSAYEREVTIGSFEARSDFQAGRQYSVWAITGKGALDGNFAKLSFQRGLFMPSLLEDFLVNRYCELEYRRTGVYSPANCVSGVETVIVTPRNFTGTTFSILAPTAPSFNHPTQTCTIPPGYPANIKAPSTISEQAARELAPRILSFQRAFTRNEGKKNLGCPTNFVHQDTAWWPRGGWTQDYDGSQTGKGSGAVMLAPGASQAFWVHGAIWSRYTQIGGPKTAVGEPTGDEQSATSSKGTSGAYQGFTRGWLYFNGTKNRTYYVVNAIAQKYQSVGLHKDQLGFPTSDEYAWNGGARSDFEGGYIYWTTSTGAVIVRNQAAPLPTIDRYTWNSTPVANQPFSGTITGTGFVVGGTQVYFCVSGGTACYQHPPAGVSVGSATSLSVTNVNLGAGAWQIYVQTSAGSSAKSAAFTVQAPSSLPTIGGYNWNTTPTANQPFGGTISGTNFVVGGTQVFFCVSGTTSCYQHPPAGVRVNSSTSLNVSNVNLSSGTYQIYVQTSAGLSARSAAFTMQTAPAPAPTISGFSWNSTPTANQPFGGTITGTGFVSGGTQVFFCVNGSSTCYQHPAAGVTVNSSTSLSVSNVNLGAGSWQIYVQTSGGQSARSSAFIVQSPAMSPPTITGYSWSTTPRAGQSFSGMVTGTNFVAGGTQVFFCVSGTSTCYQHPSVGVSVNSSTSLSVSSVNLSSGSWQVYVRTAAGQSARSSAFTVQAAAPTISGYSWNTTPTGTGPFGGTITGTGFVGGGTRVFFCVSGTGTCYEQPSAGISISSSTSLSVSNVRLSTGSWQFYVQTSVGQSTRSTSFTVR